MQSQMVEKVWRPRGSINQSRARGEGPLNAHQTKRHDLSRPIWTKNSSHPMSEVLFKYWFVMVVDDQTQNSSSKAIRQIRSNRKLDDRLYCVTL